MRVRLQALREQRGYSQSELSRRSGVSQSTISRLELMPYAEMGAGTARRLADALGVSMADLLPGDAVADAAMLLPRTVQAIPRDAPASFLERLDRQVEGLVLLALEGASRPNQLAPHRNEKDGPVNDGEGRAAHGSFKRQLSTYGAPLVPPVHARELALV